MNTKSIVLPKKLAKRVAVVGEPVAVAEPVAPIEGATVCDRDTRLSFPEWLNTIDGKSCSDPRFLPAEPARRQAEITRRLHLAWIAAKGGEG